MILKQFLTQFENIDLDTDMNNFIFYKNKIILKTRFSFIRHKCCDIIPDKPGIYLGYEQYDPEDQYLVEWTGEEWLNFETGSSICFGDNSREDYWSELSESFLE